MQVEIIEFEEECKLTKVKSESTAYLPCQDSYKREGERNGVRDRLKMPNRFPDLFEVRQILSCLMIKFDRTISAVVSAQLMQPPVCYNTNQQTLNPLLDTL